LRRKAADLLARRGFDGDCMRAAIRQDPDDWSSGPRERSTYSGEPRRGLGLRRPANL